MKQAASAVLLFILANVRMSQDLRIGTVSIETVRASTKRFVMPEHVPGVIVRFRSQTRDKYEVFAQSNAAGYATVLLPPDKYCVEAFDLKRTVISLDQSMEKCLVIKDGKSAALQIVLAPSLDTGSGTKSESIPEYKDDDAYDVYAAILPKIHTVSPVANLVQQETQSLTPGSDCPRPDSESGEIAIAFDQYRAANGNPWLLQAGRMKIGARDVFPKAAIGQFHPSVYYVIVSAVGFNPSRTVAVLYVASSSKYGGDMGGLYAAQKKNGQWELLPWNNECSWIS